MNFTEVLESMLVSSQATGVALMGSDGISIAQVGRDQGALNAIGVEFGRMLPELQKAGDATRGGILEELTLRLMNFWVLIRPLDPETLVVMTLAPDANVGKARFEIRRRLVELRELL